MPSYLLDRVDGGAAGTEDLLDGHLRGMVSVGPHHGQDCVMALYLGGLGGLGSFGAVGSRHGNGLVGR